MSGLEPVQEEQQFVRDAPYVGGVRNDVGPRFLGQGQFVEGYNVSCDDPSRPRHRDGYTEVRSSTVGLANPYRRGSGLAVYSGGPGMQAMVAAYRGFDGGVYVAGHPDVTQWAEARVAYGPGTDQVQYDQRLDVAADDVRMFQAAELVWILTGSSGVHAMRPDGKIIDCGGTLTSPPRGPADGVGFLERVLLYGGSRLSFSKTRPGFADLVGDPIAFDRTNTQGNGAGFLEINPDDSTEAVAVRPFRGQSLICFSKTQLAEVVFNPGNPLLSTVRIIARDLGAASRNAILAFGDDLWFADREGQIMSLTRSAFDVTSGTNRAPISRPFRGEIPGRVNLAHVDKMRAMRKGEYAYWFYPRDSSTEANACMAIHLPTGRADGPWVFARPFSGMALADFGAGPQLYAQDGGVVGETSKVYRMFEGARTDNGIGIPYRETGPALDWGMPEADKRPTYVDFEITGDVGAKATLYLRTSENDEFAPVATAEVESNVETSFPLVK